MHPWDSLANTSSSACHNLSSKSANSDFPFTLFVLCGIIWSVGTRPPFSPEVNMAHCHQVKEARAFTIRWKKKDMVQGFLLRHVQPTSKHVLLFSVYLPIEKAYPTKQRHRYWNSQSCKLLLQLIANSATKGLLFLHRQFSLSHSSSAPAAKDWAVVLNFQVNSFLQRLSSFSLASASPVQHDNDSWHFRKRAFLTNTYNLNLYGGRACAWPAVFTQNTVP